MFYVSIKVICNFSIFNWSRIGVTNLQSNYLTTENIFVWFKIEYVFVCCSASPRLESTLAMGMVVFAGQWVNSAAPLMPHVSQPTYRGFFNISESQIPNNSYQHFFFDIKNFDVEPLGLP